MQGSQDTGRFPVPATAGHICSMGKGRDVYLLRDSLGFLLLPRAHCDFQGFF